LPPRNPGAMNGTQFVATISGSSLSLTARENMIFTEISNGNVPAFYRNLVPVTSSATISSITQSVTYYVIPDYLAVGCDSDYFLCPMSPMLATHIADITGCTLPTRKMVDDIYAAAAVKLTPKPIPYSPTNGMTTVPVWENYNDTIKIERDAVLALHPLGALTGGDKKDVVISTMIYTTANRVVIYGWHTSVGNPIQPMTNVHADTYMDYSHGIRLVQDSVIYNGNPTTVKAILQNSTLNPLLSDEGVISQPQYPYSFGSPQPVIPVSFAVLCNGANSLRIVVSNDTAATHYQVYTSTDGVTFAAPVLLPKASLVLNSFAANTAYFIKIAGYNSPSANVSAVSELLSANTGTTPDSVLMVYSYDRVITGNTYNYVIQHGQSFHNNHKVYSSATRLAVTNSLVSLNTYSTVDYILGQESTVNSTFTAGEQNLVSMYLQQGGHLFVSGSEIAWDLDKNGTTADKAFFNNYLKASYTADDPGGLASTYYSSFTASMPASIYPATDTINFDNGTHGTYNVAYPDVVIPMNGGVGDLHYATAGTDLAGIHYAGVFPSGTLTGKMVYLCFPFETIYPASRRDTVLARIIRFFGNSGLATDITTGSVLNRFRLFPNPVQENGTLEFEHSGGGTVKIQLLDISGRQLRLLADQIFPEGQSRIEFSTTGLSAGLYLIKVETAGGQKTLPFLKTP
ncbi:MAG TPA: T9SS type A sorting domain-containing protein, partial [Bacteroidia bacterium]|nr:T9SS type A sorting domain-containing protein [Bacteroidia bacterium]